MNDYQSDLKAYLDGELTPERAEAVRLALLQDEDLRQEYEFMKLLTNEIKSAATDPKSEGEQAVINKLAKPRGWGFREWSFAAVAGVVVIAALGLVSPVRDAARISQVGTASVGAATERSGSSSPQGVQGAADYASPVEPSGGSILSPSPDTSASSEGVTTPAYVGESERATKDNVGAGGPPNSMPEPAPMPSPGVSPGTTKYPDDYRPYVPANPNPVDVPAPVRQVVKEGNLEVKVSKVNESVDQLTRTVQAMGGYLESSTRSTTPNGEVTAHMRMRVLVERYEALLLSVRQMGDVIAEDSSGNDVTGSVMDYAARLQVLRAEEANYIELLRKARGTSDILQVKQRLADIRMQIEQWDAQKKNLEGQARYSTLSVTLRQGVTSKSGGTAWLDDSLGASTKILGAVAEVLGRGLVFLAVLAPIWAPVAGLVWWLRRRAQKAS